MWCTALGLREGLCSGNGGKRSANFKARYGARFLSVNPLHPYFVSFVIICYHTPGSSVTVRYPR